MTSLNRGMAYPPASIKYMFDTRKPDSGAADVTPGTIIPAWYGERLDLDHAIYICLANAANKARQDGETELPQRRDEFAGV